MSSIELKIDGKQVVLHTHTVGEEQLYKAQDLLVNGYGLSRQKAGYRLKDWKESEQTKLGEFPLVYEKDEQNQTLTDDVKIQLDGIVTKEGRNGGTYLTKEMLFKLAAYVDKDFYDSVFKAFVALTEGDVETAMDVALSVAISQEIIDREAQMRAEMVKLVGEKIGDKSYYYSNYFRLLCKAASGYTPSELTNKGDGAFKYILGLNHVKGASAYVACLELIVTSLKIGLDYHATAALLSVKTGKNKDYLLE